MEIVETDILPGTLCFESYTCEALTPRWKPDIWTHLTRLVMQRRPSVPAVWLSATRACPPSSPRAGHVSVHVEHSSILPAAQRRTPEREALSSDDLN